MFKILFLLFIIVPIVEISILLQISEVIGGVYTILLVVVTAFLGARMVKYQGLQTMAQIQKKSAAGQIPSEELFSGVCILISGVLLLTPGVMTDLMGFALLTPMIRKKLIALLQRKIHLFAAANAGSGQANFFSFTSQTIDREYQPQDSANDPIDLEADEISRIDKDTKNVIDGEFTRKE